MSQCLCLLEDNGQVGYTGRKKKGKKIALLFLETRPSYRRSDECSTRCIQVLCLHIAFFMSLEGT